MFERGEIPLKIFETSSKTRIGIASPFITYRLVSVSVLACCLR